MLDSETRHALLELQRMESALLRAVVERPNFLLPREVHRVRYALNFARLTRFQPGTAALGHSSGRGDVTVLEEIAPLRARVIEAFDRPLRREHDRPKRLHGAKSALDALFPALEKARAELVRNHATDFSAADLDAEVGRKVLVSIAGGGAGSGFVYLGAYERLERAGIVPGYVVGASIGALLGAFRARRRAGDWTGYVAFAKTLEFGQLFAPVSLRVRYGLPGLFRLQLRPLLGPMFVREDDEPLRICDLEIRFEAVLAGVRRRAFTRLPGRFRRLAKTLSTRVLAAELAARMWQVAAFFDPRIVKEIVVGSNETAAFDVVDAVGFSAAIPGVLHYDVDEEDSRMSDLLGQLCLREELAALVDGGVASNVPIEIAWTRVEEGILGTRNAAYVAFDCFHPQWNPAHLWLQPITQAVQLQMTRNAPYAHRVVRFEPTLSPLNFLPEPALLDRAVEWGQASIEAHLPFLQRLLEPFSWVP